MTWKPEPHPLRWPVTTECGETLTSIELRALTVEEHRAALATVGDDEDDQFEALLLAATGLSLSVLEQIKRPDYVSLVKRMYEYVNLPASYFLGRKPEDPDDAELLVPIKAIGRTVDRLALQVPAMKATKVMRKLKADAERADFISAHCTGLSTVEIVRLSLPDWTQLQERLHAFLNKPADYFPNATSK
ncbi:phage tail assembly protein [Pseudomonas aeruginosa]|uniref:phage tail assembly protein n=1 Tax=Pseudomonas aeruginosa TaxID=287 RepID=UPI000EAC5715|nr:phage tail assembly protein [Pseudomonas aeruginosa]